MEPEIVSKWCLFAARVAAVGFLVPVTVSLARGLLYGNGLARYKKRLLLVVICQLAATLAGLYLWLDSGEGGLKIVSLSTTAALLCGSVALYLLRFGK